MGGIKHFTRIYGGGPFHVRERLLEGFLVNDFRTLRPLAPSLYSEYSSKRCDWFVCFQLYTPLHYPMISFLLETLTKFNQSGSLADLLLLPNAFEPCQTYLSQQVMGCTSRRKAHPLTYGVLFFSSYLSSTPAPNLRTLSSQSGSRMGTRLLRVHRDVHLYDSPH